MLVTAARDGTLLGSPGVELVDEGLPKLPHHNEHRALPLDEAVELVERASAEKHASTHKVTIIRMVIEGN